MPGHERSAGEAAAGAGGQAERRHQCYAGNVKTQLGAGRSGEAAKMGAGGIEGVPRKWTPGVRHLHAATRGTSWFLGDCGGRRGGGHLEGVGWKVGGAGVHCSLEMRLVGTVDSWCSKAAQTWEGVGGRREEVRSWALPPACSGIHSIWICS
jgi:hypothetical protein